MSEVLFVLSAVWIIVIIAFYVHMLVTTREKVKSLTSRVEVLEKTLAEIVEDETENRPSPIGTIQA